MSQGSEKSGDDSRIIVRAQYLAYCCELTLTKPPGSASGVRSYPSGCVISNQHEASLIGVDRRSRGDEQWLDRPTHTYLKISNTMAQPPF